MDKQISTLINALIAKVILKKFVTAYVTIHKSRVHVSSREREKILCTLELHGMQLLV